MGYVAVAYALYKVATPLRYTVTLGGTTLSINYLKKWGYIKPVPTTEQLKEKYLVQKENIMETVRETKEIYKERKENIMDLVRETKEEIKIRKEQLKDRKDLLVDDIGKSIQKLKTSKELSLKTGNFLEDVEKKYKLTKKD